MTYHCTGCQRPLQAVRDGLICHYCNVIYPYPQQTREDDTEILLAVLRILVVIFYLFTGSNNSDCDV